MSEQNKPAPKTAIVKPTPIIKTGEKKPLDVPVHISHPRKFKHRIGKFDIAEGSKKPPNKPSE